MSSDYSNSAYSTPEFMESLLKDVLAQHSAWLTTAVKVMATRAVVKTVRDVFEASICAETSIEDTIFKGPSCEVTNDPVLLAASNLVSAFITFGVPTLMSVHAVSHTASRYRVHGTATRAAAERAAINTVKSMYAKDVDDIEIDCYYDAYYEAMSKPSLVTRSAHILIDAICNVPAVPTTPADQSK